MIFVHFSESKKVREMYGLGMLLTEVSPIDDNFNYLKTDVVMMLYCIMHISLRSNTAKTNRLESSSKKYCTTFTPFI